MYLKYYYLNFIPPVAHTMKMLHSVSNGSKLSEWKNNVIKSKPGMGNMEASYQHTKFSVTEAIKFPKYGLPSLTHGSVFKVEH